MGSQTKLDNEAAFMVAKGQLRVGACDVREPERGQVLVSMHSVGICGSDVHFLMDGKLGTYIVKHPQVPGHESSGVVLRVGPGVTSLKPGDRVALECGIPCRACKHCKQGRYNLCPDMKFYSTPPYDGVLGRYRVHEADFCHKLPDHVSFEEGALLEPLAVAIQACRRAGMSPGKSVLICGSGPIGLVMLKATKALGASKVIVTDVVQSRLDFAKKMGADQTILIERSCTPEGLKSRIRDILEGECPEVVFECSGAEPSIRLALDAASHGGTIVLVGIPQPSITLNLVEAAHDKELDIKGSFRYANCYPVALSLVATGQIDLKPLVTHRFTLENAAQAFSVAANPDAGAIKVIIQCTKS